MSMRRFQLFRKIDVSQVSGTGIVAEGVEFTDGTAAMRWCGDLSSVAFYESVHVLKRIHGHGGSTDVIFIDPEEYGEAA